MYYIGVDIGGMSIKAGIVNDNGEIIKDSVIETRKVDFNGHISDMAEQILTLIKDSGINKNDVKGVGLGAPGAVDAKKGEVIFAPNISWKAVPVCGLLSEKIGLPVKIGNDADVATLAEVYFGSAKNYNTAVMITIGTGVGSGIVIDNKLYDKTVSAEIGHMVIVKDGLSCGCGRRGCYEQYASATGLIRQTREAMLKNRSSKMWELVDGDLDNVNGLTSFTMAKQYDKTAMEVVDNFVAYVSEGILNILNTLRPEAIIIGGGISKQKDYLTDKIKAYLQKFNYGYLGAPISDIVCAELGNPAGIVGAASLFMEK